MATSAQGNSFSEDSTSTHPSETMLGSLNCKAVLSDLLALQGGVAKRTWYRMCCNDMFCSIEWGSLSGELVNSHHSLFTIDEVAKLSSGKPCSKEAVESAINRNPPRVLHAFYKSLCATQTCGGAGQHAIIAREIRNETLSAAFNKSETFPPAARSATILHPAGPRWPANSQLASAEPDLGLDVALAHATADTAQPPPWQMCGAPAVEEWKGVVDFTCRYFGANARRDVLCTLYREVDETAHRFLCSNPSNQRLSEALQEVVQKRRMKWFRFAQYLLRSKVTCPFVFDIPKYTHVSIRDTFKQVLRRELGRNWFQLASAMGLPRTDIEDIQEQTGIPLSHKIDTFLVKFQFPSFISDRETTDFLVEALERASLPYIAAAVRRQLEFALQQEATESTVQYTRNQAVATAQRAKPYVANNKKSECPPQTDAQTSKSPSHDQAATSPKAAVNNDEINGTYGGNHVEDPPPPSSPSLGQSQPSQSQNPGDAKQSDESIGAEHTPKNVPSHMEAQSGVGMQSQTSQDNSPPCQSSVAPNPLWDKALESALGHLSSEDTIASDSLRLPSSQAPAHLTPEQPITSDTLILPSSSGPSATREGRKLSHQDAIGGLTGSEPEESDSVTAHPSSQPASSDSAQFVHLQSSSQTGSPATGHKMYTLPSTIPAKEHSLLSNVANHPAQQSSPHEDSPGEETSDNDDAHSVLTYFSSTSTSTQTQVNREQSLSSHHSQPPTTYPTSPSVPSPSEVASVIKSSGETGQVGATVDETDMTAASAPAKHAEQPLAVPCGGVSTAVSSTLHKMQRQDSGYSGSNQFTQMGKDLEVLNDNQPIGSSAKEEEMLAYVSRQVGQKWSMLARYAGLNEDDVQEIKCAAAQNRSRAMVEKIQGRMTWNELLNIVQNHLHMLNTAAKLQHFLHHPVDAIPQERLQAEIDPQQYSRTLLLTSQCVSEHWKELAQCLGINPHQHWDVLEESSDTDEKCHGLLMLWLRDRRATLQDLLQAVESTSAGAGTLHQLIEMAQ